MAKVDKEVCVISLSNGIMDNDFTIFKSGKIYRLYDRHIYKGGQNREEWLSASEIDNDLRKRLIERCPPEFKEEVKKILTK